MGRLKALGSRITALPDRLAVQAPGSWRDSGMSAADRGYGYRWQQARASYLRLHPACVMCEEEGRIVSATVVDHIVAHRGDTALFWLESNWQALCAHHHSSHKQKQENVSA